MRGNIFVWEMYWDALVWKLFGKGNVMTLMPATDEASKHVFVACLESET